jgi:hypothetical protein
MKKHELFIHLSLPKAQKRPIVMVLLYIDDLIVFPEHDTGTVKLRARCFSCPALTGEAKIGRHDTAKDTISKASFFICLTHTPGDLLIMTPQNELPLV